MNFVIVTHVPHVQEQNVYCAYAPYVLEMNIWAKHVDTLTIVAPISKLKKSTIDISYEHNNIQFVPIDSFNLLKLKEILRAVYKTPNICWKIYKAMQTADHIHLRCPGNIGLLGSLVQILFPYTKKTAKYAGNWDPNSKQPLSYKLQRWILSNTFLTKNMQVLVYGDWKNCSNNVKPFFTATYSETDKSPIPKKNLKGRISFVYAGTLVSGKNPLYALRLVASLYEKGFDVDLNLYGEGAERNNLEKYIKKHNLDSFLFLKGNSTKESLKAVYKQSHFVILPSESEGWPKAIAEGMFWGCVPIATKVSCVPYMLDYEQRGVLLEKNLLKDVAKIEAVLKDEFDYETKAKKASYWSRKYTLDYFEEEVTKLIQQ